MKNKILFLDIIRNDANLFDCCLMMDANKSTLNAKTPMKALCHKKSLFDCCVTKQMISMNTEVGS